MQQPGPKRAARNAGKQQSRGAPEKPGEDLQARFAELTKREQQVLELIVAGKKTREIAEHFGLSPRTVDNHRASIMRKTNAHSVAELIRMALDHART